MLYTRMSFKPGCELRSSDTLLLDPDTESPATPNKQPRFEIPWLVAHDCSLMSQSFLFLWGRHNEQSAESIRVSGIKPARKFQVYVQYHYSTEK